MHLPVNHKVRACAVLEAASASGRRWDKVEMDCVRWRVC